MSVSVVTAATRAIDHVLAELDAAGIDATRDPGAFYPQPVGVLVDLPSLVLRGLAFRTFEMSVLVVSGDPFNNPAAVDRVYALADEIALALDVAGYRPSSYRSSVNAEPLPAVELVATVTVLESDSESEVP